MIRLGLIACYLLALSVPSVASARQEVTEYTYDALGRLVKTQVNGGPNGGTQTNTQFDPAGNRTQHQTTGARLRVIVVPLNGFTVIPLR